MRVTEDLCLRAFGRYMITAPCSMKHTHLMAVMKYEICHLGQRPSSGTSKVIQHGQKKERKKKLEREEIIQQN